MARAGAIRGLRGYGALLLAPLVLAACAGGGTPAGTRSSASATAGTAPAPGPTETAVIDADPAKLPATRAKALRLIREVIAEPAAFGPAVVEGSPYESDPATWPVLGTDCVWRQEKPAADVLAGLSRYFEVPAAGGKGPLRLSAVVTVHRTREDARWEMAESLEETMRCPTQQLRQGESIGSMLASALARGESQHSAEDVLFETGEYRNEALGGGPYPYSWYLSQTLRFTVAVTGKGAKGWSEDEVDALTNQAHSTMLRNLESAVEKQS